MLTLVEYLLLLYRALLPTPVWYRFFLNKEYGSLFSSLLTGLYLTFKLTSVVEKVCFLLFVYFFTHFYYYSEVFLSLDGLFCLLSSFPISYFFQCEFQVQSFFAALKALSRKEVHYGAYATSEQVNWMSFMHAFLHLASFLTVGCRLCFHLNAFKFNPTKAVLWDIW